MLLNKEQNFTKQYKQIKIETLKTKKPKSILGEIAKNLAQEGLYTRRKGNKLTIEKDDCIVRLTLTNRKIFFNFEKDLENPDFDPTKTCLNILK